MLKDVGITVPKSRETSAVRMQQDRGGRYATIICVTLHKRDVGRGYALHALIPSLAGYTLHLFLYFWRCHPYIRTIYAFTLVSLTFFVYLLANTMLCMRASTTLLYCLWSFEMHMGNNEEMAFNYTEQILYCSFTQPRGALQRFCCWKALLMGKKKLFGAKFKVNTCTRLLEEEEEEAEEEKKYVIVATYFTIWESYCV